MSVPVYEEQSCTLGVSLNYSPHYFLRQVLFNLEHGDTTALLSNKFHFLLPLPSHLEHLSGQASSGSEKRGEPVFGDECLLACGEEEGPAHSNSTD